MYGPQRELVVAPDDLMERVIGAAIQVHRTLGPGLLESFYEGALMIELRKAGMIAQSQVPVEAFYEGEAVGVAFRADIVVEHCLLLELKAVAEVSDVHLAQVLTYLRLLQFKRGLLINFNVRLLKDGIQRVSV